MAIGRTNAGGAGGAALNFKVVAGLTRPEYATENTIWVKTEKITGWIFSASEPAAGSGTVWFGTSLSSPFEFNALKKNTLIVSPVSAKQNVNGSWEPVTAEIYQNGAWKPWWLGELYDNGDQFAQFTGGWLGWGEDGATARYVTFNASNIAISTNSVYQAATVFTRNLVDLIGFKKLKVYLNVLAVNSVLSDTVSIGIASRNNVQNGAEYAIKKTNNKKTGTMTLECDISDAISGYPYVSTSEADIVVMKVYLE